MNRFTRWLVVATTVAAVGLAGVSCSDDRSTTEPDADAWVPTPSYTMIENDPDAYCMGDDGMNYNQWAADNGVKTPLSFLHAPTDYNCTSNDVRVANAHLAGAPSPTPIACIEDQLVDINLEADVVENANSERYDIGIWIALDGGQAKTGECAYHYLGEPFDGANQPLNLDLDGCGDMDAKSQITDFDLGELTVPCVDKYSWDAKGNVVEAPDGFLDIGSCVSWKVPSDRDVLCPGDFEGASTWEEYRWGSQPATSAKCNCEPFFIPITVVQEGYLEIKKVCDPTGDNGLFKLAADAQGDPPIYDVDGMVYDFASDPVACGEGTGEVTVYAGSQANPGWSYDISEAKGSGSLTDLDDYFSTYVCQYVVDGVPGDVISEGSYPVPGDPPTDPSVTVMPDDHILCTFTNVRKSSLTIVKDAVPNDAQDFSYAATGDGVADFSLDDDDDDGTLSNTKMFSGLAPGVRTVTEGSVTGWDLTGIACTGMTASQVTIGSDGDFDDGDNAISVDLAAGEDVVCTFTNTKRGAIKVIKDAEPDDSQDFDYTSTSTVDTKIPDFKLDDDGDLDPTYLNNQTFGNLKPGGYTVAEGAVTGWTQTSAVCVSDIGDDDESPDDITLDPGETVTCTFVNTKLGKIIVEKETIGGYGTFDFTSNSLTPASFSLTTSAEDNPISTEFNLLPPGDYDVSETDPTPGWDLTSASCVSSIGDTEVPGDIELDAGETVTCTFVNTKRGAIKVIKDAVPDDEQDFSYTSTSDTDTKIPAFSLDDDSDPTLDNNETFDYLKPGAYTVAEGAVMGWDQTSGTCVSSIGDTEVPGDIELDPGELVTCTFVNTKRGKITVIKDAIPNDPQDFSYTSTSSTDTKIDPFLLDDDSDPDLDDRKTFEYLKPGTYTVAEGAVEGWDLTSATCDMDETPDDITLGPGEHVTCTFVNTKRGKITIIKDAVPNDAQDFSYTSTSSTDTEIGSFSLDDDSDGALPNFRTFEDLKPGTYTVTEALVTGWELTDLTCSTGGTPDLANYKTSINLIPGGTVQCTFVNSRKPRVRLVKDFVVAMDPALVSFRIGTANDDNLGSGYGDGGITGWYTFDIGSTAEFEEFGFGGTNLGMYESTWSCDDGASGSGTLGNTYELGAGDEVTCTFFNEYILTDETAFAKAPDPNNRCFIDDGFGNWGWTNGYPDEAFLPGTYTWPMIAGAGGCEGGTHVGNVTFTYTSGQALTIDDFSVETFEASNYFLDHFAVYAGTEKYPLDSNGNPTNSPGQYYIEPDLDGEAIWVIVHAVVLMPG